MNNHYISILRRCELAYVRSEMEVYGLIPLEGRLIRVLKDHSYTQEELADYLGLDKGRIAHTVSALEDKHLVCRKINEKNRRQKFVSLTPEGEDMYETICGIYEAWDAICFKGFSPEELESYYGFLKRITANAAENRKKNGGI